MTCKDATRLMASEGLDGAGHLTRLWARIHCFMCPNCRRYAAHLRGIGVYGGKRIYPSLKDTQFRLRMRPGSVLTPVPLSDCDGCPSDTP